MPDGRRGLRTIERDTAHPLHAQDPGQEAIARDSPPGPKTRSSRSTTTPSENVIRVGGDGSVEVVRAVSMAPAP